MVACKVLIGRESMARSCCQMAYVLAGGVGKVAIWLIRAQALAGAVANSGSASPLAASFGRISNGRRLFSRDAISSASPYSNQLPMAPKLYIETVGCQMNV